MSNPQYVNGSTPLPGNRQDLFPPSGDSSRYWDGTAQNAVASAVGELLDHTSGHVNVKSYLPAGYVDGVTEATTALQAVFDLGGHVIIPAGTYITNPLYVRSNTTLHLSPGTVIKAKTGYHDDPGAQSLLSIQSVSNVTIFGNGATMQMLKAEYVSGEQRHGVIIQNSTDVAIYNLTSIDSGGDGFYVGGFSGTPNSTPKRISLVNCHSVNNRRQGLSITSGIDVTVVGGTFEGTVGTDPQYGIDIEPNSSVDELMGIRLFGVRTRNNTGGGIILALSNFVATSSKTVDIEIAGFTSENDGGPTSSAGLRITGNTAGAWANTLSGHVRVSGGLISAPKGAGVWLGNWDASKAPRAIIEDVDVINPNSAAMVAQRDQVGVEVFAGSGTTVTNGNFELRRIRVYDTRGTPATYVPLYLENNVSALTNYVVEDVEGVGFAPTAGGSRHLLHVGTSTDMTVRFTQPDTTKYRPAGDGVVRDYPGRLIESTLAHVDTLPAVATCLGATYRFRVATTGSLQIRPAAGESILHYGWLPSTDLVLKQVGDYAELRSTSEGWQVVAISGGSFNPGYNYPGRVAWADVIPTTGTWTRGDMVLNTSVAGAAPGGWRCVSSGTPGTWLTIPGRAATQSDSAAATVGALVTDFNALMAKLRTAGVMAP